jgi:hypothetical protein
VAGRKCSWVCGTEIPNARPDAHARIFLWNVGSPGRQPWFVSVIGSCLPKYRPERSRGSGNPCRGARKCLFVYSDKHLNRPMTHMGDADQPGTSQTNPTLAARPIEILRHARFCATSGRRVSEVQNGHKKISPSISLQRTIVSVAVIEYPGRKSDLSLHYITTDRT